MHRLFVAMRPPLPIRMQLSAVMGDVMNARWQSDEQLHLTLRFIGEVDRNAANDIAFALKLVLHPKVRINLNGLGCFDRKGVVDTLWAGVQPRDALGPLHRKIDQILVQTGLQPERRSYLPHITLARFGSKGANLDAYLARNAGLSSPTFEMDWFGLYESTVGHGGAHYALIERYLLG